MNFIVFCILSSIGSDIRMWLRHEPSMSLAYSGAMSTDMSGNMGRHVRI